MTKDEAINLLKHHSFQHREYVGEKVERGFLGMLRPFRGELIEENYHEVMEIIQVLQSDFKEEEIHKEIVSALWALCYLSRLWGLEERGMLRRNHLISESQIEKLSEWVNNISYAVMMLMDGAGIDEAFHSYEPRNTEQGKPKS